MLLGVVTKFENLGLVPKEAEGLELRLDRFGPIDLQALQDFIKQSPLPILLTLRKSSHGGYYSGTESQREQMLEQLFSLHPTYIDLEFDASPAFFEKMAQDYPQVKILCSYHNFEETPPNLEQLLDSMRSPYAYAYKIATMAHSSLDALRMMEFVKTQGLRGIKMTGLCMGDKGQITRILGPVIGNIFDYAPVDPEEATAPGQLTIQELCETYRYKSLNPSTSIYGVIGHPVAKSLSPFIHNPVIQALKADAVYVRIPVAPEELEAFYNQSKMLGIKGLSVTMPLKEATIPFLDEITPDARNIGAVNTVAFDHGILRGSNFDGVGAVDAIEKRGSVKGKKVLIIGAGGAAKAIAYTALQRGADVIVLNRNSRRAEELVANLGKGKGYGLERIDEEYKEGYDILVNCTPEPLPIDPRYLLPSALIMDIAPIPRSPSLPSYAEDIGARTVPGYEMLINQAIGQDYTWFGERIHRMPIVEIVTKEVLKRIV